MKNIYKLLIIGATVAVIITGISMKTHTAASNSPEETVAKQKILISKLERENERLKELIYINDVLNKYYSQKSLKSRRELAELIYLAGRENNLSSELILAVILTESSFRDNVVSDKGAIGLMQLLPTTAAAISEDLMIKWRGDHTLYDSQNNIRLGAYYLRKMMEVFDDMNTALIAYNAGPTRVIQYSKNGKSYTDVYAKKVNENYIMLKKTFFEKN